MEVLSFGDYHYVFTGKYCVPWHRICSLPTQPLNPFYIKLISGRGYFDV